MRVWMGGVDVWVETMCSVGACQGREEKGPGVKFCGGVAKSVSYGAVTLWNGQVKLIYIVSIPG